MNLIEPANLFAGGEQNRAEHTTAAAIQLPLSFEVNRGQADAGVAYLARGSGFNFFVSPTRATLRFGHRRKAETKMPFADPANDSGNANLTMKLINSNPQSRMEGEELLPGKGNYFIGNSPLRWRREIEYFARVKCENIYDGIDIVYYGNQGELEYDFVVRPGADPTNIALAFDGVSEVELDKSGDLLLHAGTGLVRQCRPFIYQVADGIRREVSGRFLVGDSGVVGFQVGSYDKTRPLVIDPILKYGTYLGGSEDDIAHAIAVDKEGFVYITGETMSPDFSTTDSSIQQASGGLYDIFVIKFDLSSGTPVYSTYLGGRGFDLGYGIAVDSEGNAYITGCTTSHDFPTRKGLQRMPRGLYDVFVTKLSSDGKELIFSTYLGGAGDDCAYGIAVSPDGKVHITGSTDSTDFPTYRALYYASHGGTDIFATSFRPSGNKLLFSTYLGGSGQDVAQAIALDDMGNEYITGSTTSRDMFTTSNAVQREFSGGPVFGDGFVVKLNAKKSRFYYSTYLGGEGEDIGRSIAAGSDQSMYITGLTLSSDFPVTANALRTQIGGLSDGFVTRLDALGAQYIYSTFLGGNNQEEGMSIGLDSDGNAVIAGITASDDFPTTEDAIQPVRGGIVNDEDAFVIKLDSIGANLIYSSYIGGRGEDSACGLAIDSEGNVVITGFTRSKKFPTAGKTFQSEKREGTDAFLVKIKF